MNQKKGGGLVASIGFYAILAILLAAVGTAGYFVLYRENTPDAAADQEPDHQAMTPVLPQVEGSGSAPVSGTADGSGEPVSAPAELPEETPDIPAAAQEPVVATEPLLTVSPLAGMVVTAFSVDALLYDATLGDWRTHAGVDIAADAGTRVLAAADGTVSAVQDDALMGTTVTLTHSDGYQTTYANLQAQPAVETGDAVSAGQVLGAVGLTSIAEQQLGPHLHFSVTHDGDAVDPDAFLKR